MKEEDKKRLVKGKSYLVQKCSSLSSDIIKITVLSESKKCYEIKWPSGHIGWDMKENFTFGGGYSYQYQIVEEL